MSKEPVEEILYVWATYCEYDGLSNMLSGKLTTTQFLENRLEMEKKRCMVQQENVNNERTLYQTDNSEHRKKMLDIEVSQLLKVKNNIITIKKLLSEKDIPPQKSAEARK